MKKIFLGIKVMIAMAALMGITLVIINFWGLPFIFQKYLEPLVSKKFNLQMKADGVSFSLKRGLLFQFLKIKKIQKNGMIYFEGENINFKLNFRSLLNRHLEFTHIGIAQGKLKYLRAGKKEKKFHFFKLHSRLKITTQNDSSGWRGKVYLRIEDIPLRLKFLVRPKEKQFSVDLRLVKYPFRLWALGDERCVFMRIFGNESNLWTVLNHHEFKKLGAYLGGYLKLKDISPILKSKNLKGRYSGMVQVNGFFRDDKNGMLHLRSPKLLLNSTVVKNVTSAIVLDNKKLYLSSLRAGWCGGRILGQGELDLSSMKKYFGKVSIKRINLSLLSRSLFSKGETLEGTLHGNFSFSNRDNGNPLESFKGAGILRVYNGNLWRVDLMKGVLKVFAPVFPSLGDVRFKSGEAQFMIGAGNLFLKKLRLLSSLVVMEMEGKMGLENKNLDLKLGLSLKPLGLKDETVISKIISIGLLTAGEQILNVKIGGTLKKPTITPLFLSVLDPVKELFKAPFKLFNKDRRG